MHMKRAIRAGALSSNLLVAIKYKDLISSKRWKQYYEKNKFFSKHQGEWKTKRGRLARFCGHEDDAQVRTEPIDTSM